MRVVTKILVNNINTPKDYEITIQYKRCLQL